MFRLLNIFLSFIFVIIILTASENDVLIDKLHLNGLIIKKENINKPLIGNNFEIKLNYLVVDALLKKISLNIDELKEFILKNNHDLTAIDKCIQANSFKVRHLQMPDNFSNELEFSKISKENIQSFPLPENFLKRKRTDKSFVKFTQDDQRPDLQELISKAQKKKFLFENLDLKDLIASNEAINKINMFRDNNDITFEKEKSFFSLNIAKDFNHYSDIKEIQINSDTTTFNSPAFQNFCDSQVSGMRLDGFIKSKNHFSQKRSFEVPQLPVFEEKPVTQEKIVKNEECLIQDEKIVDKREVNPNKNNKIVANLHLKDLIAKNEIINKTKLSKDSNCKSSKKEKALSYLDTLLKKPSLNLNDLVENVLKRNPDLAATKRRIEANDLVVPRVQILDDPQFTVMRHDSPLESNSPFFTKMRYEATQLLPFPGKLRLKGKIAQQMLEFVQNEEETTMRELVLQTKRLYYQLYLNYAALKINKQNQDIISRFIEDTLALYKTGEEKYDEVLKAQVELQLLKKELLNLLSDHDFIVSMINAILDYPQENIIGKPTEFFTNDINYKYEILEQIAMRNRSELKGIKALVCQQRFKARLAKRNYFPDFKVLGRYEDKLGSNQSAWGVGVSINVPLWIPQKQRREKREAMKNAKAFQKDLESFEAKIRGNVRDLLSKIESSEEKIDLYETGLVPKTSEALLSGEAMYKTGKGDFLVLLDTIRQFQYFELEYEAERVKREIFLAELERALGVPLEDLTCFISN